MALGAQAGKGACSEPADVWLIEMNIHKALDEPPAHRCLLYRLLSFRKCMSLISRFILHKKVLLGSKSFCIALVWRAICLSAQPPAAAAMGGSFDRKPLALMEVGGI